MNMHNYTTLYAIRRIGPDLAFIKAADLENQSLFRLFATYSLGKAKASRQIPNRAEQIIYAENFDVFAADTRYLAERLSALEELLKRTRADIIVKTSSALALLATPLLKNPRINLLFIPAIQQRDVTSIAEMLETVSTLHSVGCKITLVSDANTIVSAHRNQNLRDALQQLSSQGIHSMLPLNSKKFSKKKAEFHAHNWLQNYALDEDNRNAA